MSLLRLLSQEISYSELPKIRPSYFTSPYIISFLLLISKLCNNHLSSYLLSRIVCFTSTILFQYICHLWKYIAIKHPVFLLCCTNIHLLFLSYNIMYQVLDANKLLVKCQQGAYTLLPIVDIFWPVWVFWIQPVIFLILWYHFFPCFYRILFPFYNNPRRDTTQLICLDNKIFIINVYIVANFIYANFVELIICISLIRYYC